MADQDNANKGKTAAQRAFEAEQQKQQAAYYETVGLLQTDAVRSAEAQQRAQLDQLRIDMGRKNTKVKVLKEKAMLVSNENVSKQELVDSMSERLGDLSAELSRLVLIQTQRARMGRTADEKEAALRVVFEATMERSVARLKEVGYVASSSQVQEVSKIKFTPVYCCPGGETKDGALAEARIRLGRTTTFREVCANAARYFGMPAERCLLEDEHRTLWPFDVVVTREIARYRGDQVLRLVRREENDMRGFGRGGAGGGGMGGGGEEEEEVGTGSLLKMLGSGGG